MTGGVFTSTAPAPGFAVGLTCLVLALHCSSAAGAPRSDPSLADLRGRAGGRACSRPACDGPLHVEPVGDGHGARTWLASCTASSASSAFALLLGLLAMPAASGTRPSRPCRGPAPSATPARPAAPGRAARAARPRGAAAPLRLGDVWHVSFAMLVALLGASVGARHWGLYGDLPWLRRSGGRSPCSSACSSCSARRPDCRERDAGGGGHPWWEAMLATLHQLRAR